MLNSILYMLKEQRLQISGQYIAKKLGTSRNNVWKNIEKLRKMGYEISSTTNSGYLLKKGVDYFNEFEVKYRLKGSNLGTIGKKSYFFEEIGSTSAYAKSIAEKEEEGTVIVADYQSEGKGRFDREWFAKKGENLMFSLILKPNVEYGKIPQISLVCSIAIVKALNEIGIETFIKWPNDIILNSKKVGGILTEISSELDLVKYVVIGIGLNVNCEAFNEELENKATSLFIEKGRKFERVCILSKILHNLEELYEIFKKSFSFHEFCDLYKSLCISMNKEVKFMHKNKEVYGKVVDINKFGELIVLTDKGKSIKLLSGEVSIRNLDGSYI